MTPSPSPTPSAALAQTMASSVTIKTEPAIDFRMASQASLSAPATPPPLSQSPSYPSSTQSSQDKAKFKNKLLKPKQEQQDQQQQQQQQPALGFQEFQIMSCDRHGWRYDVMRFDARKPVDIMSWARPVKLNRKELRRDAGANSALGGAMAASSGATPVPAGPMVGPDGKPVIGPDGRVVMVDSEGRPIHENGKAAVGGSGSSTRSGSTAPNGKDEKKKKKFQKKTRQVFLVPEHVRRLRRDERYPWVFEDASGKEVWEGRMEDAAKSQMHGLFMPTTDNVFRFVPVHRWYKFQKRRPQQQIWSLEEAERMMAQMQKSKDPERWLVRRQRNGGAAPQAGGLGVPSLVHDAGEGSLGPGGRRLFMVDSGARGSFGGDDDEEGVSGRRRRQMNAGAEGDIDEFEYEEDFADDEEKMQPDDMAADEEAKELEERLKREYRNANRTREGYVDESDEEEEVETLTTAGKSIKKLVRKMEKNAAYESDEEDNPYASSAEESEEEEPEPVQTGPAVQVQHNVRTQSKPGSPRPGSQVPSRPGSPGPSTATPSAKVKTEGAPVQSTVSASVSAIGGSGASMGGHSVVAKRATSPKAPKLKSKASAGAGGAGGSGSRAVSPLAGSGSRAGSPVPSLLPGASTTPTKKRKAEDGTAPVPPSINVSAGAGTPKPKKIKPGSPTTAAGPSSAARTAGPTSTSTTAGASGEEGSTVPPGTELTREVLVEWLLLRPGRTPRECIRYFQPVLAEKEPLAREPFTKKELFTKLVKEVANLKDGTLMLKPQYK